MRPTMLFHPSRHSMTDTRSDASSSEREREPSIPAATFGAGYKTATLIGSIRAGSEAAASARVALAGVSLPARRKET